MRFLNTVAARDLKRARAEIEKRREQIDRHNYLYYLLDNPEITDAEYDASHSPARGAGRKVSFLGESNTGVGTS